MATKYQIQLLLKFHVCGLSVIPCTLSSRSPHVSRQRGHHQLHMGWLLPAGQHCCQLVGNFLSNRAKRKKNREYKTIMLNARLLSQACQDIRNGCWRRRKQHTLCYIKHTSLHVHPNTPQCNPYGFIYSSGELHCGTRLYHKDLPVSPVETAAAAAEGYRTRQKGTPTSRPSGMIAGSGTKRARLVENYFPVENGAHISQVG